MQNRFKNNDEKYPPTVRGVEQGRRMAVQRQEDAVAKARQLVQASELKDRNARKNLFLKLQKLLGNGD
jgi:hypothetical protein